MTGGSPKNRKPDIFSNTPFPQSLHGYRQNEKAFREKTGGFRKINKKYVKEFVFLEADHLIKTSDAGDLRPDSENLELNQKGWWFSRKDGYYKSTHQSELSEGIEASLKKVSDILLKAQNEDNSPFDGIVAFSQGACLLSIICHDICYKNEKDKYPFTFAMFFSGFKSAGLNHEYYYEKDKIIRSIPSFHSIGEADAVVAPERGVALAEMYENAVIMKHEGGHLIANKAVHKQEYHKFFAQFVADKN